MSFPFKTKLSPPHLGAISRRRVLGGLLVVATPAAWVVAPSSALRTLAAPARPMVTAGVWTPTGSLNIARESHTVTLMLSGRVLAAGGFGASGTLSSAELYDPSSGTWTPTGSLHTAHSFHTATRLSDGRVLVAGGLEDGANVTAAAELYDPSSGTWTPTGSLNTARRLQTATLIETLSSQRVLVAGGRNNPGQFLAAAELYDPSAGTWTPTGSLNTARGASTATLLLGGRVLVAGGSGSIGSTERTSAGLRPLSGGGAALSSAELYDPSSGTWTPTGSLHTARSFHTATRLSDGRVLVAGGQDASAELYDPSSGTWTPTGSLNTARSNHTAVLLSDGRVLVIGGSNTTSTFLASAEIYDPSSGTWTPTGSLNTARAGQDGTILPSGRVLVVGGSGGANGADLASAELFDPDAFPNIQGDYQGIAMPGINQTHLFTLHLVQSGQSLTGTATFDRQPAGSLTAAFTSSNAFQGQLTLPDSSVATISGTVAGGSPIRLSGAVVNRFRYQVTQV